MPMPNQSNDWAVVTGASSGMGEVFARELVMRGYSVLAVARRKDRLEKLAKDTGGRIEPLVADLEKPEGVAAVAERASQLEVNLLVNNAGFATYGRFTEIPAARELAMIRLNIEAVVDLTHRLLPDLIRRGRGGIINVASALAFQAVPYFATYSATKAFILNFSEAVAHEVRDTGVKVFVICPGPVKTEFYDVSKAGKAVEKLPMLTAGQVVAAALSGFEAGKVVGIPSVTTKVLTFVPRIVPRSTMRNIMGSMMRPS